MYRNKERGEIMESFDNLREGKTAEAKKHKTDKTTQNKYGAYSPNLIVITVIKVQVMCKWSMCACMYM